MKKNEDFVLFDLSMIPNAGSSMVLNNEIMLADNIDNIENNKDNVYLNINGEKVRHSNYPLIMNFSLIIICINGELRFKYNLKSCILSKNHVLFIPAGAIISSEYISDDMELAVICFSDRYMYQGLGYERALKFTDILHNAPMAELNDYYMEKYINLYRQMRDVLGDENLKYKKEMIKHFLHIMVYYGIDVLNNQTEQDKTVKGRAQIILDNFLHDVSENYRNERKLQFYADKQCITPKHLSLVVTEISGRSPSDWIKDYVILEAKALLKTLKYTSSQVSDMLNFSNPSFFNRYFKKSVGCSPRQYQLEN